MMILNTINIPALQGRANKHVVEKGWRERERDGEMRW
jgi:hypothetical protein